MYAVVMEKATEMEVQQTTQNCVFFFEEKEGSAVVSCLSAEYNPLIALVFLKLGSVLEWVQ
jgi:hypothetical protein